MDKIKMLVLNRTNYVLLLPEKNQTLSVLFTMYQYFASAVNIFFHMIYKVQYPYFSFSSINPVEQNQMYNAQQRLNFIHFMIMLVTEHDYKF